MISYGRQSINQKDIDSVTKVLKSDFLTQGPMIEAFEKSVAQYCGAKYAVAVCNATAALHVACLAAGLAKGDIVWTVPNTFVASANCALYCGAEADFVDIDDDTYNMSVDELEKKLTNNEKKPKVVIPVHFSGQSCEMEKIYDLSKKYSFTVIEDASHAIGADYKNAKVGSCEYSHMTVFSFHPVKIITTGEGGMILTNDEKLYEKLVLYRSHGITRKSNLMEKESDGPWYYEQIALGFNYRITELQATLGVSQMDRLNAFIEKRRALASRYDELLKDLPLKLPYQEDTTRSSWHLYVVRLDFSKLNIDKKELFAKMLDKKVNLNLHYIPVHIQPYYKKLGFAKGDFPVSEKYYEEVFTLPLYYDLSYEEQDYIVDSLKSILKKFFRRELMDNFKTEQEAFWHGSFGDDYVERNKSSQLLSSNIALFSKIFSRTVNVTSVIEFGANIGLNLKAIKTLMPEIDLSAIEINDKAAEVLQKQGNINVFKQSILDFKQDNTWDMTLIKGVLIHINPEELESVYEKLYNHSNKYICVAEYYNPTPVEMSYRGHEGRLFKRDFAGEIMDRYPDLKLIDYGFAYHRDNNFAQDDTTWFLLQK